MIYVGIDYRYDCRKYHKSEDDKNIYRYKTHYNKGESAENPQPAGHTVSAIPVFFVVQCPWNLVTYGIVLSAFW